MKITEVRIKLMDDGGDRLQGFCSITFDDCFVVRDLKIIEGSSGPFVAMPSRKLTAHCPQCRCKNHLRAAYCNHCGSRLKDDQAVKDSDGRTKLYADIAHPINSECREMIQNRVIAAFEQELQRYQQPGYVSRYDEIYDLESPPPATRTDKPDDQGASAPRQKRIRPSRADGPPRPHSTRQDRQPELDSQHHKDDFGAGIF